MRYKYLNADWHYFNQFGNLLILTKKGDSGTSPWNIGIVGFPVPSWNWRNVTKFLNLSKSYNTSDSYPIYI